MALVIPDGFGQVLVNVKCLGDADPYVVTWGCTIDEVLEPQAIVDQIKVAVFTNMKPLLDVTYSLGPVTLRVPAVGEFLETYVNTTVETGSGTVSQNLPQNCAVLVHKRTNRGGRSGRGRFYMPGVTGEEVNEIGELSTDYRTDYQTRMDALLEDLDDDAAFGGAAPGMWLLHDSLSPGSESPTKVRNLQVDPVIATQRRRLRK